MALVHIIGDPRPAEQLAQQLRDRGYEIEIFPPGTQSSSKADLEITVEQCSAELVISKAVAVAQDENACLLVSSGIIAPVITPDEQHLTTVDNSAVHSDRIPAHEIPADTPLASVFEELARADDILLSAPHSVRSRDEVTALLQPQPTQEVRSDLLPARDATRTQIAPQPISHLSSSDISDWPIWQIVQPEAMASESVVNPPLLKQSTGNHSALMHNGRQLIRWTSEFLKITIADRHALRVGTATAAIVAIGLLFVATFHRFSPLPARLTRASSLASQPVPFQKASIANSAHPRLGELLVSTQVPAPQVQTRSVNVLRASHELTQTASDDAGFIAKDIVIRYGSRSASRHIFSEPIQPGVKYYSDLTPTR